MPVAALVRRFSYGALTLAAFIFVCNKAEAQYTWNQTTGGNWSTATWIGGTPASGPTDTLTFAGSTSYQATDDIAGAFLFKQLIFNNSSASGVTIATSGTQVLTFGTAGTAAVPNIALNNTGPVTISATLNNGSVAGFIGGTGTATLNLATFQIGSANDTVASGSNITVNIGLLTLTSGNHTFTNSSNQTTTITTVNISTETAARTLTLTTSATGAIVVTNGITNGSTTTGNLIKGGAGTLTINGASTYTGSTTINNGVLAIGIQNALPTSTTLNLGNATTGAGTLDLEGFSQQITALQITTGNTATTNVVQNSGAAATLSVSGSTNSSYGGLLGATGAANLGLTKAGGSTLALTGSSSIYTGHTTINGGILSVAGLSNIGNASSIGAGDNTSAATNTASLVFGGGTLSYTGPTVAIDRGFTINAGGGTIDLPAGVSVTFGGNSTGAGALTKTNTTGTLIFTGNAGYTGGTTINGGTLQIGAGGTVGTLSSNVLDNGALVFNRSDSTTFAGNITGAGSLTQNGASTGTLILTGTGNNFAGGTTITAGTLQIGDGGADGSIAGAISNAGTLISNSSAALAIPGNITGTGGFTQAGSGVTTLTGTNKLNTVNVNSGTLKVQPGSVGATDNVTVANAATFAAFNSVSTSVAFSSLSLGSGSGPGANLSFYLNGAPTVAPIAVNSNNGLTANGTTTVNIYNNATPLSVGEIPLLSYAGTVQGTSSSSTNFGFTIGVLPSRVIANIDTTTANLIQLNITKIDTIKWTGTDATNPTFWDINNSQNWVLKSDGVTSTTYLQNSIPGDTVTFDGSATGSKIVNLTTTLSPGAVIVDTSGGNYSFVGTGGLSGPTSLLKQSAGTLIIANTGTNNFAGGTTITGGTLQIGDGTNTGSLPGNVVNGGTLAFFPGVAGITYSGNISGSAGSLQVLGNTVILTGANTNGGGTTITSGVLQLGDGTTTGTIVGNVLNNGTLAFNPGTTGLTFSGSIAGNGAVQVNTNTTTITGANNTFSGGTTIASGATLQIGDGSTNNGSLSGNVTNNGTLLFSPGSQLTYGGNITGSGAVGVLNKTTILTGSSAPGGATTISSGATLQLGDGATFGSYAGSISNSGTVAFDAPSAGLAYGGANAAKISGAGGVNALAGTTTLTSANTYTGATTISNGATLTVGLANAVPSGSDVTVNATGTLNLNSLSDTIKTLSGAAGSSVTLGTSTLTTLTISSATASTFSGVISGTGSIARAGGGTLILGGNNTYSGSTLLSNNNSKIQLAADNALPTGTTVNFNGTGGNTLVILDLHGHAQQIGSLTTANVGGTTYVENDSGIAGTSILTIQNGSGVYGAQKGGTSIIRDNNGVALGGQVALVISGGTTTLTDGNTYTGGTTVSSGTLALNTSINGDAAVTGTTAVFSNLISATTGVTLGGGTLQIVGRPNPTISSETAATIAKATTTIVLPTVVGLSVGQIVSDGFGTANFPANTYITSINSSTKTITLSAATTNSATVSNDALAFSAFTSTTTQSFTLATLSASSTIDVQTNGGTGATLSLNALTGAGNLNKISDGLLQIAGANNTFTGNTVLGGGTVKLLNQNALQGSTIDTTGSGALAFDSSVSGKAFAIGGLTGPNNVILANNAATPAGIALTVGGNNQNTIYSGSLSDSGLSGSLIKIGSGVLTLAGANTFTGGTTVSAGELRINGQTGSNSGTGAGNVTISGAGLLSGTGQVIPGGANSVSVGPGGTIRGGFAGGTSAQATGTLTIGNALTLNGGATSATAGTLAVDLNGNANPTTAPSSNSLIALGANTLNLVSTSGPFNIVLLNDNNLTPNITYTITLASALGGSIERNGTLWDPVNNPFTSSDFNLTSGSGTFANFSSESLVVDGSNNLNLQFVPTSAPAPEPHHILLLGALTLLIGLGIRRTWTRIAASSFSN